MCQTNQMKDPPFHSLSPEGRTNKIPCQPFKFLCIICKFLCIICKLSY
jgi:hypothetical protein